jgi:hypothetical protein
MGFWGTLFNTGKLNADPSQRSLAQLLIDGAEGVGFGGMMIENYIDEQGWSRTEAENRLIHALSMVKVWRPDLYAEAKKISLGYVTR